MPGTNTNQLENYWDYNMKWLEKFYQKTSYPDQQLTEKQLDLLNRIDTSLVVAHSGKPISGQMTIRMTGVPFMSTVLPIERIAYRITLEYGDSYIPRSIALVVDSEGNWLFLYAVRTEQGSDDVTCKLFLDALNRTNNARS
jgi:hypothetical protein